MNRKLRLCTFFLFIFIYNIQAQKPYLLKTNSEVFTSKQVLTPNPLRQPFAMVMGPDDSLWVTERRGYVTKVSPVDGGKTQLLDISALVNFTYTTGTPYTSAAGATSYAYASAAGATSSASVITVTSTTNLAVGMRVYITAGTGVFAANTTVTAITSTTKFTVSAAPTTALSGGATVVKGNSNIITVGSTNNLQRGMTVTVSAGTGAFPANTTVASIISSTKFSISALPTIPLPGGTTVVKATDISGISQDGMFGIALHPELSKGTGNDYVYLAYCYNAAGLRKTKIVRYNYSKATQSLTGEITLLQGLSGSTDHNAGRLVIGDFGTAGSPDYKLVYTCGDKGSNQFANACDSIESQYTPTAAQMSASDYHRYNGKILRLNLDGSIPADNPTINGVQTHIYSYGHRNPQGLTFEKKPNTIDQLMPSGKLYSSEQGPATDDEVNMIQKGKNYGWPRVAGKKDNGWYRYYEWADHPGTGNGKCSSYNNAYPNGGECSLSQTGSSLSENTFTSPDYTDPLFDLYPTSPISAGTCDWLSTYPTIAPSSVIYYPFNNKIPGWSNSLLITTLKTSAVFRLKLNATGTAPGLTDGIISGSTTASTDSVVQYFNDASINRYRDIVIGKDGITFYLLTDSVGGTSGPSYGQPAGVTDKGAIVKFVYTGTVLAIGTDPVRPENPRLNFNIYPNPASSILTVESKRLVAKPLHYQLYDAAGKIVLQGTTTHEKFNITVGRLGKGMYILKVLNAYNINVATEKVIIN